MPGMLQGWLALPLEWRALLIGGVGVLVATQLNRAIYRWAWYARPIGPWSAPHPDAPPRSWRDRIPVVGWWLLRREAPLHGHGYWVRPMLLEVGFGVAWAFLYLWLSQGGHLPLFVRLDPLTIQAQFLAQASLVAWMTIATFIDIDEQTIPDLVTIPGTLMGLALAALLPHSLLPTWHDGGVQPLLVGSPEPFPAVCQGTSGLWLASILYLAWWLAIWPKTVTLRHGLWKGLRYLCASMARHPGVMPLVGLVAAGMMAIVGTWWWEGAHWQALFSALVGLAWGGAMVWGVRIVGRLALGKEAMGFGDVTLLAMIGTYLGWQSTTLVFFIAPFTGVVLAIAQWIFTGRPAIPYGPFLAAGTVVVLIGWATLWTQYEMVFRLGWGIPVIGLACLVLMGLMLTTWRKVTAER